VSKRELDYRLPRAMTRRNLVCQAAAGAAVGAFLFNGRSLPVLAQEGTPAAQLGGCMPEGWTPASPDDKILIAFSQGTMNHPWRVAMVEGNQEYAAENYPNVELVVTDGQNQASKQVSDVESLIVRQPKVLIISPLTAEALTPVVERALAEGIPVVTLDRMVDTCVSVHVGAENLPIGRQAAEFLAEKLNGKGQIIEIQGTAGASATVDRHNGFAEVLANYPNLKVVAEQTADYLREPATSFMEDMLQRFGPGEIDAVYAHNDEMALGAIEAIKDAGRLDEILVVGIDGQETAFESVKAGEMAATFIYPFVAPEGIITAYQLATGEEVEPVVILESQQVDSSNVDEFLGKGF
jgi:ribose transport system substrate-binding protein